MNIVQCNTVIKDLKDDFDSHDFIRKFMEKFPAEYGELLKTHNNVNTAHAEIGRYLLENSCDYSEKLEIKQIGVVDSLNVFLNMTPNALWHKILKQQ